MGVTTFTLPEVNPLTTRLRTFAFALLAQMFSASVEADSAWVRLRPVQEGRQEVAVAAAGGRIYLMGGLRTSDVSPSVEVYDPATDLWRFVAPLPEPLHHSAAVGFDGHVYLFGGFRTLSFDSTDAAYRYDPAANLWTPLPRMPGPRGALTAAVIGNRIYVVGGTGPLSGESWAYEPATERWITIAPMPTPREHLAAGVVDGRLYVVGGRRPGNSTLTTLEEYDPLTDRWRQRASMPTGRSGIAAAGVGGRLYVFGGEGNPNTSTGVFAENESYDPITDRWRREVPMALPRHGIAAAVIGDRIYLPAGAIRQGFGLTRESDVFIPSVPRLRPVRRRS